MKSKNIISSPKAAALAASFVMLIFNATYYTIAARLEMPLNSSPIPPDSLNSFPMQIADWTGKEIPMDKDIISVLDNEAYINRLYSRQGSTDSVILFFSCGFSSYNKIIHRPEICYPAAGWKLINEHPMQLKDSYENKLPCTIFEFSKHNVETQQTSVLHYYIVDGQPLSDIQILRPRLWRLFNRIDYVARVLITTSENPLIADSGQKVVSDFAVLSAPFIASLLDEIEKARKPDSSIKALAGN